MRRRNLVRVIEGIRRDWRNQLVDQHEQWPAEVRRALGRVRHRVETALSTLTTAFNINQPRGRTTPLYSTFEAQVLRFR